MATGATGAGVKRTGTRGGPEKKVTRGDENSVSRESREPSARMGKRTSAYGKQLSEKNSLKLTYGMREAQFKRFYKDAQRQHGGTGENLLVLLERRLDNVVFALKLATTRRQARQMITHRHVKVNGNIVKSPSYLLSAGDTVSFVETTLTKEAFVANAIDKRLNIGIKVPEWLELRKKDRSGVILRLPERGDISADIQEHLIVELYSK